MKVIDWKKKGNVVRYYLGEDDLKEWHGDDWNDYPYECNAGTVYDEFTSQYVDIAYPYDFGVVEPQDDWDCTNSSFCKDDFRKRKAPFLIIADDETMEEYWGEAEYKKLALREDVTKVYFGDPEEKILDSGVLVIRCNIIGAPNINDK